VRDKSLNQRGNGNKNCSNVSSFEEIIIVVKVEYDRWGNVARMEISQSILIQMIE
jgi:hypothetical protein